jgi:hypothetical protein
MSVKSAYIFFARENRSRIKKENPGATFGEIGRILSAEWNKLNTEQKARFAKMAEEHNNKLERENNNKERLLNQIKIHMKSNIIANFIDGDDDVVPPRDPIVKALVFIDSYEVQLDMAANIMYNAYQTDDELDDLENAEADWYREYLYETISYSLIMDYISQL